MIVLDGKTAAANVLAEVRAKVERRVAAGGSRPHLAVVFVGDDPASEVYVRGKHRDAEQVGIESADHRLPGTATTEEVTALVDRLNRDPSVSGVLVQQPFPAQVEVGPVVEAVDPGKDVDGFHPTSLGRLVMGEEGPVGPTPSGVLRLLDEYGIELEGRRAAVIGRSTIVGKPTALLLLQRNATVTVCHSRTRDLPDVCRAADVLVAAIGRPHFVTPEFVKEGAAVVDVGVNRGEDGKLAGDVHPDVREVAGWLSPVPGGVGLMTRAMLMVNTLRAEELRNP
ncbi:MAG: bifunctional 5,10-methylenetetrahydrofolate dehydrogenase/5,10-methenyltetrahydrofolate cyclohydrolase [bacterium]|nr:bifunctional 5,10-methylenetetrahydrofolate dehydrogenase/5,10-methenyltetrahydrofolate cyclohydrolase [bacterium]